MIVFDFDNKSQKSFKITRFRSRSPIIFHNLVGDNPLYD